MNGFAIEDIYSSQLKKMFEILQLVFNEISLQNIFNQLFLAAAVIYYLHI